MSGRELAFDRSVLHPLQRRRPFAAREESDESRSVRSPRPDASFLVEAISNAAVSISARNERIQQLEEQHREFEDLVDRMKSKLGEMLRLKQASDTFGKSEKERADRAEAKAARLESRVQELEADLDASLTDLHRIADVISGSLLTPDRR